MRAVIINHFGKVEDSTLSERPKPQPGPNEVQIKVSYAGVNPVDWKIMEGGIQKLLPHEFPITPGWDAAGVITAIGNDVSKFKIGDEVYAYCRKPTVQWGTYADYVCFEAENVAFKPKKLNFAQASAIPLAALTAWQALFDHAKLKANETILIHAGAGGVGGFAIEFAKYAGVKKIYTTASKKNHEYVKGLGADIAIDYTKDDFVEKMKEFEPDGVDVVLDCAGYETLKRSYDVVKKGGRIRSIVHHIDEEKCREKGLTGGFVFVRPDGKQLKTIGELVDSGKMRAPVITEYPIEKYKEALEKIQEGHTRGKIVLKIG